MEFELNKGQKRAIEKAIDWYFGESYERNLFVIGGYAGSGKSSLVKRLIQILGLAKYNVIYAAFTGKAASNLRIKGNLAHTIHKTFYHVYKRQNGTVGFKLRKSIPNVKLIIIDEVSMINDEMIADIVSFGIPVIALGDLGQLPPIFGKNRCMTEEGMDVFLTEIMRQTDESGILTLATIAREGKELKEGTYGNSRVFYDEKEIKRYSDYDMVLCWKNSSRKYLNDIIRKELCMDTIYPVRGERVMCFNNSYAHEIDYYDINVFNSEIVDDEIINAKFRPDFIDNDDYFFDVRCNKNIFDSYHTITSYTDSIVKDEEIIVDLDFGYASTVHKSQGSEWGKVLLIDEYNGPRADYCKWLYTGITRGKNSIDILIN